MKNIEYNNIDVTRSLFSYKDLYLLSCDNKGIRYADRTQNRKQRSIHRYQNLHLLNGLRCSEEYGIPLIYPVREMPALRYVSFADRRKIRGDEMECGIHFFIDDYKFENILDKRFDQTTYELCKFGAVFTPDLSIYSDIPTEYKKVIIFKRQLYGAYWQQKCGLNVIPCVGIPDAELLDYALDGIPENSVLAFCGIGHCKRKSARDLWLGGLYETIRRKHPIALIISGKEERLKEIDIPITYIPSHIEHLRKFSR